MNMPIKPFKNIIAKFKVSTVQPTSITSHRDVTIHNIYEGGNFHHPQLNDIFGNSHALFGSYDCEVPGAFVGVIRNGRCRIGREEVFSSTNEGFIEITSQKTNPTLGRTMPKKCKKIEGSVVNLSLSDLENNYSHFNLEWMARLHLLKKSNIYPDYYIVPHKQKFHKQYLDILGIEEHKRITIEDGTFIQADELIVPSLINNWDPIEYLGYMSYLKQWVPYWLSEVYESPELRQYDDIQPTNTKRIYISRERSAYRKVLNESEIINYLETKDFSVYYLESMTVIDQIRLFNNAEIIVSMHGAGLSNICHCRAPAKVLEIYSENYHDSSLRLQILSLGHKYEYYVGKTPNSGSVHPQKENVIVDIVEFKQAIQKILRVQNKQ